MSIVELVRQPEAGAGARSLESAARSLLDDIWSGTLIAITPEDQWLVRRIEDALAGLDEIREMAAGDDAKPSRELGVATPRVSILAPQTGATG